MRTTVTSIRPHGRAPNFGVALSIMKHRTLRRTELSVSALGLGTSPFGGVFGDVGFAECKRCLDTALDAGINLLDCSPFYGQTKAETMLGRTLRNVARERYIVATKVGRYGESEFDFSAVRVTQSVDESLARLGLETIDIIQCHDIEFGDLGQICGETLPALRAVVEAGKARYVGVTGLPLEALRHVARRADVDTVLSYCHFSLNDTTLQSALPFFEERGVGVISASPLSMGLLTERGAPDWHPAPDEIKSACRRAAELCRERGASLEKLAIQFSVGNAAIATTLVGSSDAEQIERNARWLDEPIDKDLLREVEAILSPIKDRTWPSGRAENQAPTC